MTKNSYLPLHRYVKIQGIQMAAQERAAIGVRNDEELQFLEDVRNAFSLKSKMYISL